MNANHSLVTMALGRPVLHLIVGAIFAGLFTWPLVAFDAPLNTWTFIYLAWGASIAVLFAFSRGEEPAEEGEFGEDDE